MDNLPQLRRPWRVPRVHLEGTLPAVLRFSDGQRVGANLQVISLTGGLLSLSQPVVEGSTVKLMFLTESGSVFGGAEMLRPVTNGSQPFRFLSLPAADHRRLGALIWEQSTQNKFEQVWMEKLRAASAQQAEARPWRSKLAGAFALLTLGLATAAYLLHPGLLN